MKNKRTISILILSIAILFTVVGYFILPETLVMQISYDGSAGTTMPKLLGLAFPLILTFIFTYMYYKNDTNKNLLTSFIALLIYILIFVFNL